MCCCFGGRLNFTFRGRHRNTEHKCKEFGAQLVNSHCFLPMLANFFYPIYATARPTSPRCQEPDMHYEYYCRVGRKAAGQVIRLFTPAQYAQFDLQLPVEMSRCNLDQVILKLQNIKPGISVESLPLITRPPLDLVEEAYQNLESMRLVTSTLEVTGMGQMVMKMGCGLELACLLVRSLFENELETPELRNSVLFCIGLAAAMEVENPSSILELAADAMTDVDTPKGVRKAILREECPGGDMVVLAASTMAWLDSQNDFEPHPAPEDQRLPTESYILSSNAQWLTARLRLFYDLSGLQTDEFVEPDYDWLQEQMQPLAEAFKYKVAIHKASGKYQDVRTGVEARFEEQSLLHANWTRWLRDATGEFRRINDGDIGPNDSRIYPSFVIYSKLVEHGNQGLFMQNPCEISQEIIEKVLPPGLLQRISSWIR